MSRAELVECRINLLKQMDEYICNTIGDEEIWEIWIAVGVPDEARDEDYAYIAEDDEMWKGVCVAFGHLASGYIEQGVKSPYFAAARARASLPCERRNIIPHPSRTCQQQISVFYIKILISQNCAICTKNYSKFVLDIQIKICYNVFTR